MRKRCNRLKRAKAAPCCVAFYLASEVEITERMAIHCLVTGVAEPVHFDRLLDVADMLLLAATEQKDATTVEIAHLARLALSHVADRYRATKKLGVSGEELKALEVLVDVSTEWWARQSGSLFVQADEALTRFRKEQRGAPA